MSVDRVGLGCRLQLFVVVAVPWADPHHADHLGHGPSFCPGPRLGFAWFGLDFTRVSPVAGGRRTDSGENPARFSPRKSKLEANGAERRWMGPSDHLIIQPIQEQQTSSNHGECYAQVWVLPFGGSHLRSGLRSRSASAHVFVAPFASSNLMNLQILMNLGLFLHLPSPRFLLLFPRFPHHCRYRANQTLPHSTTRALRP